MSAMGDARKLTPMPHKPSLSRGWPIRTLSLVLWILGSFVIPVVRAGMRPHAVQGMEGLAGLQRKMRMGADLQEHFLLWHAEESEHIEALLDWTLANKPAQACTNFAAAVKLLDGSLILSDNKDHAICLIRAPINSNSSLELAAGKGGEAGYQDGTAAEARFTRPQHLAVDTYGNVYIADTGNCAIRMLTPEGHVGTVAGQQNGGAPLFTNRSFSSGLGALMYDPASCSLLVLDKGPRILYSIRVHATCQPGKGGDDNRDDDEGWRSMLWGALELAAAAVLGSTVTLLAAKPEVSRSLLNAPSAIYRDVGAIGSRMLAVAFHMLDHVISPARRLFLRGRTGQSGACGAPGQASAQHLTLGSDPGHTSTVQSALLPVHHTHNDNQSHSTISPGVLGRVKGVLARGATFLGRPFRFASWQRAGVPAQSTEQPSLIDLDPPTLLLALEGPNGAEEEEEEDGNASDSTSVYSELVDRYLDDAENVMPPHSYEGAATGEGQTSGGWALTQIGTKTGSLLGASSELQPSGPPPVPESVRGRGSDASFHSAGSRLGESKEDSSDSRERGSRGTSSEAPFDFLTKESLGQWASPGHR